MWEILFAPLHNSVGFANKYKCLKGNGIDNKREGKGRLNRVAEKGFLPLV